MTQTLDLSRERLLADSREGVVEAPLVCRDGVVDRVGGQTARLRECAGMSLEFVWTPTSGTERLLVGEVDGEEPMRSVETLELYLTTLGEFDPRVRNKLPHKV